jgi:hypothetical protein
MDGKGVVFAAFLALVLAACGGTPMPAETPSFQVVSGPSGSVATAPSSTPAPTAQPTPTATPKPTAPPIPPKPSGVTFSIEFGPADAEDYRDATMTVTWRAPRTKGVEIRIFGVTQCFPAAADSGKTEGDCLVEHTPLPDSVRRLLATAPASAGKATWTWRGWDSIGGSLMMGPDGTMYESVVIAAYNSSGHSIFAIAAPGNWCTDCTY